MEVVLTFFIPVILLLKPTQVFRIFNPHRYRISDYLGERYFETIEPTVFPNGNCLNFLPNLEFFRTSNFRLFWM